MKYSETRIYKLSKTLYGFAQKCAKPYSSKFSKRTFTQPQHIAINCLKRKIGEDYRETEEIISEMPRIQEALGLSQVPDFTTTKKAFDRLSTHVFVVLLLATASVFPQSGVYGADSTGFPRSYASRHYTKRCRMRLKSLKVTFIVDSRMQCIVGVHITGPVVNFVSRILLLQVGVRPDRLYFIADHPYPPACFGRLGGGGNQPIAKNQFAGHSLSPLSLKLQGCKVTKSHIPYPTSPIANFLFTIRKF